MITDILIPFFRIAAFSISLVNDKTEKAVPALDSLLINSIVDVIIYKENALKVGQLFILFHHQTSYLHGYAQTAMMHP